MINTQEGIVVATRRIAAPAAEVFALLADPTQHVSIDGSDMLVDGSANDVVRSVGDMFTVKMHHPEMGDYVMDNYVVAFEDGHLIVWAPVPPTGSRDPSDDSEPGAYQWGFELTPEADGTLVTEFFDCSRSPQWLREATDNGNGWTKAMEKTLANIAARCASPPPPTAAPAE